MLKVSSKPNHCLFLSDPLHSSLANVTTRREWKREGEIRRPRHSSLTTGQERRRALMFDEPQPGMENGSQTCNHNNDRASGSAQGVGSTSERTEAELKGGKNRLLFPLKTLPRSSRSFKSVQLTLITVSFTATLCTRPCSSDFTTRRKGGSKPLTLFSPRDLRHSLTWWQDRRDDFRQPLAFVLNYMLREKGSTDIQRTLARNGKWEPDL